MKNNIKIPTSTIQECANKGIKFFYAYDSENIFRTLEEAQTHRNKNVSETYKTVYGCKIWYFFFDKNLEISGFSTE